VEKNPGTLFIIATPLGNLEDMSPRAVKTLETVDLIACEDTRHSRKMLQHFGVEKPTTSYHEHNEDEKTPQLISRLVEGQSLGLISDAGTPLLSDPGYRLVKQCHLQGISVIPIPGPFAGAAAASVSGLPTDRILFVGFLPKRKGAQEKELRSLRAVNASLVFYLSPHHLARTIETVADTLGKDRLAFLIREMTKIYESSYQGTLQDLCDSVSKEEPRGEYTLVVEGCSAETDPPIQVDAEAYVRGLVELRGHSTKDAIRQAASDLEIPRRELYGLVMSKGKSA
jgi:16S rRNA (cytidine1402-2'-O)-methyltransferase